MNVTVPHKLAALAAADEASAAAREIGAANTLSFSGGRIVAENTDAIGILDALPGAAGGQAGAGDGRGRLRPGGDLGAQERGRRGACLEPHRGKGRRARREFAVRSSRAANPRAELRTADFDLILNATTVGLAGANPAGPSGGQPLVESGIDDLKALPLDADALHAEQVVVDLVYGSIETQLIAAARAAGATPVDGLEVLVRQGAASLRLWTGAEPPLDVMRARRGDQRRGEPG